MTKGDQCSGSCHALPVSKGTDFKLPFTVLVTVGLGVLSLIALEFRADRTKLSELSQAIAHNTERIAFREGNAFTSQDALKLSADTSKVASVAARLSEQVAIAITELKRLERIEARLDRMEEKIK